MSGEDFADLVQAIEGFHRGEVVDVEMEYLIAHGREHRVVELEKRQLCVGRCHVQSICRRFGRGRHIVAVVGAIGFELLEDGFGSAHDVARHTG